ncbi:MAG TPA: thiol-disulfide oxidoreductase DCC family protein [Longimicrobium sp.]|nr:thiol-disulfide oxidoreductase DCC family protein [Longimicrobium sp.]
MAEASPGAAGGPPVVLFDGVCNFCNASVNFIIDRDPRGRLRFAALQSEAGEAFLRGAGMPTADFDTVVLVEDGRVHTRSDAALRIARRLSGAWPLLAAFRVVPRPLRDLVYDLVARNRYRLFGKRDACMLPSPEVRARFLG